MPIKKAAEKAWRQTKKRTQRNKQVKDAIAYSRRAIRKALESQNVKQAVELAKQAVKLIDKAAQNKVLKKNTAARIKSRLALTLNKAQAAK
jgi:small subunit ribosomal protein S20